MKFVRAKKLFSLRRWFAVCLVSFAVGVSLYWSVWIVIAANRTWTGGTPGDPSCPVSNPLWTNPCNWASKALPVAGDDLTFGSSLQSSSVNNFANGTTFNSLSVSGAHQMSGNSLSLNAGITAANALIAVSSLKLNNNQTFNAPAAGTGGLIQSAIDTNGKTLTLAGPGVFQVVGLIGGSGGLIKNGSGVTLLAGNNTYTGPTEVNDGTLMIFGSQPGSSVSVNDATLGGAGTVGSVQVTSRLQSGFISPGNVNHATGVLTVNGNLSFSSISAVSVFNVDLNGVTSGSGYDQLNVAGTVNLSAAFLDLTLGFTPSAGATFVIINKTSSGAVSTTFPGRQEGSLFTVNNTTFFITYKGGDGNDVVLHVPQTKTWSGAGTDSNWTTGANWQGGSPPQPGDILEFPATASRKTNTNDFPAGTPFSQVVFSGPGYSIEGNGIKLLVNLLHTNPSGATNFFRLDMSGPGGITANGGSALALYGNNTITGTTNLLKGVLFISGSQATSPVAVSDGTLRGNGTTGSVTATGGAITPGGDNVSDILTIDGTLTLNSAATFRPTPASGPTRRFLRLSVSGSVDLGGSNLDISDLSGLPAAGESFKIIDKTSSGPIQGTFNGKPEGSVFNTFGVSGSALYRISYVGGDGNDVTVTAPTTRTWSGGGTTNNWSEGANWFGGVAPGPGDSLVFPSDVTSLTAVNDFQSGLTFNSITISGAGYSIGGSGISLLNGVSETVTSGNNNSVLFPIKLLQDQTFSTTGPVGRTITFYGGIDTTFRELTIDGSGPCNFGGQPIVGSGGITRTGTGLSVFYTNNTYSGFTRVSGGSLRILGSQPTSPVILTGGRLEGSGLAGPLGATAGTLAPGPNSPPVLSVNGNLTLNSSTSFEVAVLGIEPNTQFASLNVSGAVNLGNATLISSVAAPFPAGDSFTIINKTSAGAVQNAFKNLPEGATLMIRGFPFRISYIGGDGNDVVLTKTPPVLFTEEGTNRAVALDSVTFVRGPFKILADHNFSADHRSRVILFTSNLGLTQPDSSVLTVQAAQFNLEVEKVGTLTVARNGIDGSYIVVRLPDFVPPGDYQMSFTLRGVQSNAGVLSIIP